MKEDFSCVDFEFSCENFNQNLSDLALKGMPAQLRTDNTYNLVQEQVSLPCATLKMSAVEHNIQWMQSFVDQYEILLAPHGKTSLTPAIIKRQIAAGAWGMTMATIQQAYVAFKQGAKNIIIANQLIGQANFELASQLVSQGVNLLICVDNANNVRALNDFFSAKNQTLNVLVEVGVLGGRCGVRNSQQLNELVDLVNDSRALSLQGIEFYEGVIHGDNEEQQVRDFLNTVKADFLSLYEQNKFATASPIFTGAGSAWYDVVMEMLVTLPKEVLKIVRPGCYVSHDKGIYQVAQNKVLERLSRSDLLAAPQGDLVSAIEVWAYVQSRPEPNKLIINVGKRDVAFDTDLPILQRAFRQEQAIDISSQSMITTDVMDQHMFVKVENDNPLQVGDVVVMSTSHPCITFDKWRYVALADDQDNAIGWMKTEF